MDATRSAGDPTIDVRVYFNFRSPYCYLASRTMFRIFDEYRTRLIFRPLGGWHGRSAPDRAAKKIPIVRQDVARFAQRLGLPFLPPPSTTDPTAAAAVSLLAEERGVLREYIVATMHAEWALGRDIGAPDVLLGIASAVGLDAVAARAAMMDPARLARLDDHWAEAEASKVFGVPTFVVGDQLFWGQDRLDFVLEHLQHLGAARR